MAVPGRTRLDVARELAKAKREQGKKVTKVRPLGLQLVSSTDSVLGSMSRCRAKGLEFSRYDEMIKLAFHEKWWKAIIRVNEDGSTTLVSKNDGECEDCTCAENEFSLIQYNFSLFFGLAVQLYEATLVSDDSPWDRFRRLHPNSSDPNLNPWTNLTPSHISRFALFGAHLFNDRTRGPQNIRCSNCHEQNELTDASVRRIAPHSTGRCATAMATSSTRASTTSASGPPRTTSASVRATFSAPLIHAPAVPWRSTPNVRPGCCDQGFRGPGRVQDPIAPKCGPHSAVLSQRRRANSA